MPIRNALSKVSTSKKGYKENLDEDAKGAQKILKNKNKERGMQPSSDVACDRLIQMKKKKNTVPELNPVSERRAFGAAPPVQVQSQRKGKPQNEMQIFRTRPLSSGQAANKNVAPAIPETQLKTIEPIASPEVMVEPLYTPPPPSCDLQSSFSPKLESFISLTQTDSAFKIQFPDFESFDISSEIDDFTTCCNFSNLVKDFETTAAEIPLPQPDTLNCSAQILSNFKNLLEQHETNEKLLQPNEVVVLQDIVRADDRHRQLRTDDFKMLKDILVSQLKEIYQQEKVIKVALDKLRGKTNKTEVTTIKAAEAEQPLEEMHLKTESLMEPLSHKAEVDVIFKNVPTLEKEIQILKSLGQKLEATLNKTIMDREVSPPPPPPSQLETSTILWEDSSIIEHNACVEIISFGRLQVSGWAQEFDIRHQSIEELKKEQDLFFLPMNTSKFELKQTSFEKLSQTPEVLMRSLKSAGSTVSFNSIEQDPIFLNKFLVNWSKDWCSDIISRHHIYIPSKFQKDFSFPDMVTVGKCGADGDHVCAIGQLMINSSNYQTRHGSKEIFCSKKKSETRVRKVSAPIQSLKKQRKYDRRHSKKNENVHCPPSEAKPAVNLALNGDSNCNLLKTLLVGSVQVMTFILMIMAFTYPDLECF